ncbi:hypothetical protein V501_07032 [Pseudogymnoascus sp. VKM F-4519 (FW-2642)]|nr:hypothetical protein V501_07032 [Pseudogymnoascus sp. VKM F-4519 (FW-2642)]
MFGIAQGPTKQTAADAINVFSGRLQSATLLEDRRNAILGLRSFARQFPASVASGALRGLIGSLGKDVDDVDTVKVVLETLIMLFNPDESSPEASEEISLWLADEFTQRQDNITILLDLLETSDFYSRLYSLQLLGEILSARSERTEECIFTAPLGISRLVAILDDRREVIRNEGLTLLTYLTPHSTELQKLVAFENAFDRIFTIIKLEGALSRGDRVVEDCLILLANLLRMNVSNQSFFRETGCTPKLGQLLSDALNTEEQEEAVAEWAQVQRNRNIYALLAVLRLFLVRGAAGTPANQASFWQHGVLKSVLQLAFDHSTEMRIKSEALITCGDIIRGNSNLQEAFAQLQVSAVVDVPVSNGDANPQQDRGAKVYVIDGLLDLTLSIPSLQAFDARLAACECIKAYIYNHPAIRQHFFRRAIDGHSSGADETANVLTTLLRPTSRDTPTDPYRYWFAAVIVYHLICEDGDAKAIAMGIAEGDTSSGEEEITCIQTITANLINGLQRGDDERVLVGYLMLLCGWLFEDPDAVNDFLGEGSNVQSLVRLLGQGERNMVIVQGLCALLLGIVYEFSTKDSPLSRPTLHKLLVSQLGRDQYIDRLHKLRRHPLLHDFEVLPQKLGSTSAGTLPDVYFDSVFVDFVKDNFSRIQRAIDRDPGLEIPVISNGIQKGISREMVDSLRSQLEEKEQTLQKVQSTLLSLERQLDQERADNRKAKETATQDTAKLQNMNETLQYHHNQEMNKLRTELQHIEETFVKKLHLAQRAAEDSSERVKKRTDAEIADLKQSITSLQSKLEKASKDHLQDLQTAHDEYSSQLEEQVLRVQRAEDKTRDLESSEKSAHERTLKAESLAAESELQKAAVQAELDDLLMVFGDTEDKLSRYKEQLRELGEAVSDGENDDEGDDDKDEQLQQPE